MVEGGLTKVQKDIARNLLALGLLEDIAKSTGLTMDDVLKLQNE